MTNCLVCEVQQTRKFLDFGWQPIANAFLTPDQFKDEYFYHLWAGICPECHMVQLGELVSPEILFGSEYPFLTSTSQYMVEHFREFAERVKMEIHKSSFVVEIGCNDGTLLKNFKEYRHLGFEPSANVAQVAQSQGLEIQVDFFDREVVKKVVEEKGKADVIISANTVCHILNLNEFFESVDMLLAPDGVLIFEDPYLGSILEKVTFDQFYDEHIYYFSVTSVKNVAEKHGFYIGRVEPQRCHGGSMRYWLNRKEGPLDGFTESLLQDEKNIPFKIRRFQRRVDKVLRSLRYKLQNIVGRCVGYGATSKSTTLLNLLGHDAQRLEYIVDTTPTKQGKCTPGTHIPVLSYEHFVKDNPDVALLLAWNHQEEILAKEKEWRDEGGIFITYVPEVKII